VTAGRYYFAEPGTPHLPGYHHFGSRNYHDANWLIEQGLGEDLAAKTTWDNGTPPAVVPASRIVGSAECLRDGEKSSDAAPPDTLVDGYPALCYTALPDYSDLWHMASTFNSCSLQRFYAKVIELSYDDNVAAIVELFSEFLGPTVTTRFHPAEGLFTGVVTVVHPDFSIVVIDGTRDFQQLATQVFLTKVGPTDFGAWGTLPLWMQSAQRANVFLTADGADPTKPVMLSGHSYGASTAANLAALFRRGNPNRIIRMLTFGCPKIGDQRMIDVIDVIPQMHLANDTDLVTVVPPDGTTLSTLIPAIGIPVFLLWNDWRRPPNQVRLDRDGSLHRNDPPIIDTLTLLAMLESIVATGGIAEIPGHRITLYGDRTARRCPDEEWPIDGDVEELIEEPLYGLELGFEREPAFGEFLIGTRSEPAATGTDELEVSVQGWDAQAGAEIGTTEQLALAGAEIGVQGWDAQAGAEIGTTEQLALPGADIGVQGCDTDSRMELGTAEPPASAGLDFGLTIDSAKVGLWVNAGTSGVPDVWEWNVFDPPPY